MNRDAAAAVQAVLNDIENGAEPIALTELAKQPFIPRKNGRKPHISCAFRWASAGLRGHKLETARCAGVICTTRDACLRFFQKLNGVQADTGMRPPGRRERAIDLAERELEAAGL